jgi:hypothetical protein
MTVEKRIIVTSKQLKQIRVKSKALRRLAPECVAKALGAELVETGIPESLQSAPGVRGAKVVTTNRKR